MDEAGFLEECSKIKEYENSLPVLEKALSIAKKYLQGKKRISGDSFYDHNFRVGLILLENKAEPEVIAAGILHGISDHLLKEEFIASFGEEIFSLVQGVESIKAIKEKNPKLESEMLRKIILTTLHDPRVITIKLANKLDNLRTIQALPQEEQKRIAEETLSVYAPLAYRLGAEKIRIDMENLSFKILKPHKYEEITNFLEETKEEREKSIEEAIEQIRKIAAGKVEIINIKGRPKHIYSIYKKMTERRVSLDKQYDLLGIRVIVPEIKDCYTFLGILHEKFEPATDRLKDYIANPKPNFYRSIHTGVILPNGKTAEVQIRTPEMDAFAEEGLAAHWKYKGLKSDQYFEKKVSWLRGVLDLKKEDENKENLENLKVDLFGDKIYCYTPKGDAKELSLGATILDFAYLVHEQLGNCCVGARVNGKFVPLKHKLNSGDVVEIITNKNQRPRMSWIKFVQSGKTRQRIRKSLKEYDKLPAFHYRMWKPLVKEEEGILIWSEEFPKAVCVLAKCCHPLPGEEIAGLATKRRIISVHRKDCRLALKEEERWVNAQWKDSFVQKIKFNVIAGERSGVLSDLLHTIASASFEVKEAKAKMLSSTDELCSFAVIPRDLNHLKELVKKVEKVRGVKRIFFE